MEQKHWGSKEAKKAGQKFRREARNIFSEYQKALFKKLEDVRILIRPKPRFIPRKVWLWFADIFVDLNSADKALVFETPSDFLTRKHHEAVAKRSTMRPVADEEESDDIDELLEEGEDTK